MRHQGTPRLPLLADAYTCADGPAQGARIVLTEHSRSTAWLDIRGDVGRYVLQDGKLKWEAQRRTRQGPAPLPARVLGRRRAKGL